MNAKDFDKEANPRTDDAEPCEHCDALRAALEQAADRLELLFQRNRALMEHPERVAEAKGFYEDARKALGKQKCPPHDWDRDGERCTKCGDKDWM